jgi:hypothetical protein
VIGVENRAGTENFENMAPNIFLCRDFQIPKPYKHVGNRRKSKEDHC